MAKKLLNSKLDQPKKVVAASHPVHDPVNPSHYHGDACMLAIEEALGVDGAIAFLRGQIIKYVWRLTLKGNPVEDNKKLGWYQQRLQGLLELKHDGGKL